MDNKLFDIQFTLLQKSLDFRTRRNGQLAGNVANLETPGFKAKDLVFERALREALDSRQPGPLRVTDPRHMDGRRPVPLHQVRPTLIRTASPTGTLDQNSVDLETEMAKIAENQLAYQALTRMITHKFDLLKTTIRDGDR